MLCRRTLVFVLICIFCFKGWVCGRESGGGGSGGGGGVKCKMADMKLPMNANQVMRFMESESPFCFPRFL